MATLFGTTADGQSLPVQVNEFGQLVAQGLPGLQGPPGPEGPMGPVGEVAFTTGDFLPVLSSTDPEGSAFAEYDRQFGYWYRFGPLLTVQIRLRTSTFVPTNPRGQATVGGLPPEAFFASPSSASLYSPSQVWQLYLASQGECVEPKCYWDSSSKSFPLFHLVNGALTPVDFADLDSSPGGKTTLVMSFSGLAGDAVRSVPIPLDDLV